MSQSQPKTQTITQNTVSAPWSGQQSFLTDLFRRAQNQSNVPMTWPGNTVPPFSPETEAAFNMTTNRALNGSPVMNAAQGDLLKTLQGGYLDPTTNPGWGAMTDAVKAAVMPAVSAQFANSGGSGGLQARAMGMGLGDAMGKLAYQNYGDERNRMMQANMFAPQAAQSDYYDIAQLGNVGSAMENKAGSLMQQDASRNAFEQNAPWNVLGNYQGLIGGNYGGTTSGTQTVPVPTSNPWAQALGMGMGGTSILGMTGAFGPAGWLTGMLSDERLKTDIKEVGATDEGLPIYTYRYKDDPSNVTRMGVMAQEVAEVKPEAVAVTPSGYLAVDYSQLSNDNERPRKRMGMGR